MGAASRRPGKHHFYHAVHVSTVSSDQTVQHEKKSAMRSGATTFVFRI